MLCFAVLAHDDEEVLQDQVNNLRTFNPNAKVILYNGGHNSSFGNSIDVAICPYSRPLVKGRLGRFLYDVMIWLKEIDLEYDYLVSVDSDVMFLHDGFEEFLQLALSQYDAMGINMGVQYTKEDVPDWYPGQTMWKEWDMWQPFFGLMHFAGCLNCMQVYKREMVRKMIEGIDRTALEQLFEKTQVFALEEILHPTLAVRSGARCTAYPHNVAKFVRLEDNYTENQVLDLVKDHNAYFIHPVQRKLDDPVRSFLRKIKNYRTKTPSSLTIVWASYVGGVETAIANRLGQLNALGIKTHAYFYYSDSGLSLFETIPHHVGQDTGALVRYIQEHQFECVTFVNTLHNLPEVIASGYKGTCIFELHGFSQPILEELNRINGGKYGKQIQAVVVPGNYVAAIAKSALWRRPDIEIFLARNTVDSKMFRKLHVSVHDMQSLGVPAKWLGYSLIGWVGRIERAKNWRMLLQIFRQLKEKHPKVKLVLASDLSHSGSLNDFLYYLNKYQMVNYVLIITVAHELMPMYYSLLGQSGGFLLSTSFTEGYPYNLLEAQACECPVISTSSGGAVEAVIHGATGLMHIFSVQDAVQLAEKLFSEPQLRDSIVQEAREKVCSLNAVEANIFEYAAWLQNNVQKSCET